MPFSISPDPKFLWLSPTHQEAISVLQYGLIEDKGFLVLTGEVGTGKTLLIKNLIRSSPVPAIIVAIPDPGMKPIEFFRCLADEAGMAQTFNGKAEFFIQLKHFLLEAYGSKKKVLLIIDESQRLNHKLLNQIRLLSNIEMKNRKLINIFFIGQNEFVNLLLDERNKATRQRIAVKCNLIPFTEDETGNYIKHRLKIAGCTDEIFNREAIREVHRYAQGYPRTINVLCDKALLMGFRTGFKRIGPDIVIACEYEAAPLSDPVNTVETETGIPQTDNDNIDKTPQTEYAVSNRDSIAAKTAPSIERTVVISVLLLLIVGFAWYYIYIAYLKDSQRWVAEDIIPKQNLLVPKKIQKEISNSAAENEFSVDELIASPDEIIATKPEIKNPQDLNKNPVNKGVKHKPKSEIKFESEAKTVVSKHQQQKPAPAPVAKGKGEKTKKISEHVKPIAPPSQKVFSKENAAVTKEEIQHQADPISNTRDIRVPGTYDKDATPADTEKNAQQKIPPARLLQAGQKIMVYFDFASSDLSHNSVEKLDLIAQIAETDINSKILIEGFTDTSGNYWVNKSISQQRADIVKKHLVAIGISPGQVIARGMGQENPIADNNTHEGRKRNRRVEITIIR